MPFSETILLFGLRTFSRERQGEQVSIARLIFSRELKMQKTEKNLLEQLIKFKISKNSFDFLLFNYGPILTLAQFNITVLALIFAAVYSYYAKNTQTITWAVASPVYFGVLFTLALEAVALRNFFKKIPQTLAQIWDEGILEKEGNTEAVAESYKVFLAGFEQKLNSSQRLYVGLPMAVLPLVFFWSTNHIPHVLGVWFSERDLAFKLVVTLVNFFSLFLPAMVIGYAAGVGAWKSIITAVYTQKLCKEFSLRIQPSHPDKAGGLKPLGSLIFSLASIIIVASLALSGMVILANTFSFWQTLFYSKIFLGISIGLSLIIFIWPLLSAHERMLAEKNNLNKIMVDITNRISELERSTQKSIRKMNYKERQEIFSEIDSLKILYGRLSAVSTWPFDREIILKFATPQIFSVLSLIGVAEPIIGAVRSLFFVVTGSPP